MLLKPFLPKAKTVSIPVQDFEDRPPPIAEYKEVAGKRIEAQGAFHQNREAVDRLSHVRASRGKKDSYIGRQEISYPPQHADDTLKVFGIESFADLDAVAMPTTRQSCG